MKSTKALLLVLLLLGLSLAAFSQKPGQKGRVKSVVILDENYDALVRRQYKESETYYDQRGNIIEEIIYKQGKVDTHFKYQYDSENNKIREEEYDSSGRLIESSEYTYEEGLRMEKLVFDASSKLKSRKVYQYTTY